MSWKCVQDYGHAVKNTEQHFGDVLVDFFKTDFSVFWFGHFPKKGSDGMGIKAAQFISLSNTKSTLK